MNNQRIRLRDVWSIGLVLLASVIFSGCNSSHPGNWDEATVETNLKRKMNLKSIDLSPNENGFSGSGTDSEGEIYQFTVTQNVEAKELKYVAEGNRGATEDGSMTVE